MWYAEDSSTERKGYTDIKDSHNAVIKKKKVKKKKLWDSAKNGGWGGREGPTIPQTLSCYLNCSKFTVNELQILSEKLRPL